VKSAAFRITVYRLRDGKRAFRFQATPPPSQADIDQIERLGVGYQDPGTRKELREEIRDAAAQYAASWTEGQLGVAWRVPQSFPLDRAADLLNSSGEWLCGLVEHSVADAGSAAGIPGPVVPMGAGITTDFLTAPVTALLGDAARVCEIAGIVIGFATGAHLLFIASAKLFAHDELGDELAKGFGHVINGDLSIEDLSFMAELDRGEEPDINGGVDRDPTQDQNPDINPDIDGPELPPPTPFL